MAAIMPDRCTSEYERVLANTRALLPYRHVFALLGEVLAPEETPDVEAIRQRFPRVSARRERERRWRRRAPYRSELVPVARISESLERHRRRLSTPQWRRELRWNVPVLQFREISLRGTT